MAPQPKADEYIVEDQEMENYDDKLLISKVSNKDFRAMLSDPLHSPCAKITDCIIQNMAIQICRILDNKVTPTYSGDILCFVPGIKNFFDLRKNIIKDYTQVHKGANINDVLEITFLHSRFSEELKD